MAAHETIRRSARSDIPRLAALFEEVFGTARPPELWSWKFFDHPRGGASYLCETGGRIVAHCGGTPVVVRDMKEGGGRYLALQSVDFMSSPTYAGGIGGGGVFVRTVKAMFADYCGPDRIPMVYGFPGERHRLLGERLLGYRTIEAVTEFTLRPDRDDLSPSPLTAGDLAQFATSPSAPLSALRDETYLHWRYLRNPARRYRWIRSRGRLGPSTLALLGEGMGDDAGKIFLMEIGGNVSAQGIARLADSLRRLGREVVFWGSGAHPLSELLTGSGFTSKARDHAIEARFFSGRSDPAPGELYFTAGDYDVH